MARRRRRSNVWSGSARRTTGTVRIIADGPLPGVLYGYAFNISKCQGYMDCVQGCIAENNQDRKSGMQYIRIHELKNGSLNFTAPNTTSTTRSRPPVTSMSARSASSAKPALRRRVPGRRDVEGARRRRRDRLRLVHRLPLLHGGVPVRRAPLQLDEPVSSRRPDQPEHPLLGNRPPRRAWSRSVTSACTGPATAGYPACVEACPVGRAQVRQPPRSRERDQKSAARKESLSTQGRPRYRSEVLVLHGLMEEVENSKFKMKNYQFRIFNF